MRIPSLAILVTLPALMLSITAGAGFPSPAGQTVEGLFGTVASISPGPEVTLITIESEAGPVEISATTETQVRIPGQRQAIAADLTVGDPVAVRAAIGNETGNVALSILVRPDRPVRTSHFTGVVTSLGEDGAIRLSPLLEEIYPSPDPYLWSLVLDRKGNLYAGTGNDGRVLRVVAREQCLDLWRSRLKR